MPAPPRYDASGFLAHLAERRRASPPPPTGPAPGRAPDAGGLRVRFEDVTPDLTPLAPEIAAHLASWCAARLGEGWSWRWAREPPVGGSIMGCEFVVPAEADAAMLRLVHGLVVARLGRSPRPPKLSTDTIAKPAPPPRERPRVGRGVCRSGVRQSP